MSEHLSDLELDALRISGSGEARKAHLDACETCRARKTTLDEAARAFAARFDTVGLAAQTLAVAREQKKPWWRGSWLPAVAAATAALVFAIFIPSQDSVRRKGDAPLAEVFVVGPRGPEELRGSVAKDAHLAIRVSPAGPREVRLLWSSAPDQWGALYPDMDAPSWKIDAANWLGREVVLDGAPEDEELAVIACETHEDHDDAVRMLIEKPRQDCTIARARITKR